MDKIASKIAALGVPGLVLVVAMSVSGFYGAAALTVALAALGGPLGMLGGIAVLGVLLLIAQALTEYGFETVFSSVVEELLKKGISKEEILEKIGEYPISHELKSKLKKAVQKYFRRKGR